MKQANQEPKLLHQVRAAIRTRHLPRGMVIQRGYIIRTEQAYGQWLKRFVLCHNQRHPIRLGTCLGLDVLRFICAE